MIRTVALLGLVASASAFFEHNPWKPGLSTTFPSFINLPLSSEEAEEQGWQIMEKPTKSNPSGYDALVLWADLKDPTRGILVDENGQTSGVQIAIRGEAYYDMVEQGFTKWTFENATGETETRWTTSMYFVSEDESTRKNYSNESLVLREDYVVVEGYFGKLFKIATNRSNIDSIWKKQACVPFMGHHYYYNMTTTLGCDKPLFTYFLLFDINTNQLIGIAVMIVRKQQDTDSSFLEHPSTTVVKVIVPTGPQCMYDLVEKYGATTIHIPLVDNPRLIFC